MRITKKGSYRILFSGMNLQLQRGGMGSWMITTSDSSLVNKGFSEVREGIYALYLPPECLHMYSAYKRKMYCIYERYQYSIETIIGDLSVLYPEEKETRRALGLHIYDDSRLKVFYEDFIASVSLIWEEREAIQGFAFDVPHHVSLYKDGEYLSGYIIEDRDV